MSFSNSYIRAFVICVLILVAFIVVSFQKYGADYWAGGRAGFLWSALGISLTITIALVGTFSRKSEKPWPWFKIGVACFGCWLATIFIMMFLVLAFIH